MQGNRFTVAVHLGGTLAADQAGRFAMPCPALLEQVSAVASNAASSTLKLGTATDDDGYLVAAAIGVSGTPVVFERGDFGGLLVTAALGTLPRLQKGDTFLWTLDFDGAAGTAGQNVSLVFTFLEG